VRIIDLDPHRLDRIGATLEPKPPIVQVANVVVVIDIELEKHEDTADGPATHRGSVAKFQPIRRSASSASSPAPDSTAAGWRRTMYAPSTARAVIVIVGYAASRSATASARSSACSRSTAVRASTLCCSTASWIVVSSVISSTGLVTNRNTPPSLIPA